MRQPLSFLVKLCLSGMLLAGMAWPQAEAEWTIDTIAGRGVGDNGPAVAAQLNFPNGVAVDAAGNLYIATGSRIRKVDVATGTITTIAGTGAWGYSGDGGPAVQAQLSRASGVAVDRAGNLYTADSYNQRIRRVDAASGIITTVAGTGATGARGGYSGDGGPAVVAQLNLPNGVAVDGAGNLYTADSRNHRIRRVDVAMGIITTIAGTGKRGFSGDGSPAVQAQLFIPFGVAVDGAGNLYVADSYNHRIRRVDAATGITTTIAGTGGTGFDSGGLSGDGGPAAVAQLNLPIGVAVDAIGNLYIADSYNYRIRRVDATGTITTVAGGGDIRDGGPAVQAQLNSPYGVAVDATGNLYIADSYNHRIRRVDVTGTITTVAGTGATVARGGYSGDGGPAGAAQLSFPRDVALDGAGNLYIADSENHRIRRVDAAGTITTIAGTGEYGYSGDGGLAFRAKLNYPRGVAVDDAGNLYITDSVNHRIRRVDAREIITTIAGTGGTGFDSGGYSGDGGPALQAQLGRPTGVAVDGTGNLHIATGSRIRKVDVANGTITTIAGTGEQGFSGDGGPAVAAQLDSPHGVAVDSAGNLYIADTDNHRIRILTPSSPPSILQSPTDLKASAVSSSRINLAWRDNSNNETGFRVQRRLEGSADWMGIGTTTANATTFSDAGLSPGTSYTYRVQAFNNAASSAFSNEATATTLASLPPTVTRFTPTRGPVGTRVTLTGTHFLGATAVRFNGVSAFRFEVVSMTSLRAVVPPSATSGPISVVTPGGTGVSADAFTVTSGGISSRLFVPIVLKARGRAGSFFTSEMTLTNRGSQEAAIGYTYTTAISSGSGTATDSLGAGRQRVIPDAIAYLTSLGVPIGAGAAVGTLGVEFSNLPSASEAGVTVRTSTPVEEGRAGLAYLGLSAEHLLAGPVWLAGLRQNAMDRSNVAVQHAGEASQGNLTLRVTAFSGDPAAPGSVVFPEVTLSPGGFHQYSGLLATAGFENGYVKVERVRGTAPYYAYGVINDQANSDGSFVFPVTESSLVGTRGQTLPVIVETGIFHSELAVTNFSASAKRVHFSFVADAIEAVDDTATVSLTLEAGEQRIIPNIVNWLRQQDNVEGMGPAGQTFAGAVFATVESGDMSGIVIGARTGSAGGGGQYSVFYNAVPDGAAFSDSAWVYGLQQNAKNRSNLALVNTGEVDGSDSVFELNIYDGDSGALVNTVGGLRVAAWRWRQLNGLLDRYAPGTTQGYIEVRKISGANPFLAYGVINDGAAPGQRSGDGAYVPARE